MAADSRAWANGHWPIGNKQKIHCLEDGTLIGCVSSIPGAGEFVIEWYKDGADPKATMPASYTLLAVKPDGTAFLADDNPYLSGPLIAEYYAVGSGRSFALGALAMGATAERAVEVGIFCDTASGGQVFTLKHKE